nr:MAG TPA: hypothetical protein [Inoviridae sp.]
MHPKIVTIWLRPPYSNRRLSVKFFYNVGRRRAPWPPLPGCFFPLAKARLAVRFRPLLLWSWLCFGASRASFYPLVWL